MFLPFFFISRRSVTAEFDERQYLFLKRLCQVLVTLGESQLFYLWVRDQKMGVTATTTLYLLLRKIITSLTDLQIELANLVCYVRDNVFFYWRHWFF